MKALFTFILMFILSVQLSAQWVQQNPLTFQTDITSVFFTNQNNGFAVSDYGLLFKTTDNGINWFSDMNSNEGTKLNSVFMTSNPFGMSATGYTVGDNGTIKKIISDDNLPYFTLTYLIKQVSNTRMNLYSVYFTTEQIGYCSGNGGTILKTTDGGTTWVNLAVGISPNYSIKSLYFIDSNTGYAVGGQNTNYVGIILKTTNAGSSWVTQYSGQSNRFLYSVHFENATTGWACGWNGTVLKTTNGGTNWVVQTSNVTNHLRSISFRNLQEGFAVGDQGKIIKTTNGGTNWTQVTSNTTTQLNTAFLNGSNSAVTAGNKGITLKSGNGGSSWEQHLINNTISLKKVLFISGDVGFIVGGGLIYKTTNNGQTWNWKTTSYPTSVSDLFFVGNQIGWTYSDSSVFKTTNGGETWVENFKPVKDPYSDEIYRFGSIYFLDANNGWVAARSNYQGIRIHYTTNGGSSWNVTGIFAWSNVFNVKFFFKNLNDGWIIGTENDDVAHPVFYHSTDGGKNWEQALFTPAYCENLNLKDVIFSDNNKGFIVGGFLFWGSAICGEFPPHQFNPGAVIIRTTDGGINWLRRDYNFPGLKTDYNYSNIEALNSIYFPDASTGYCVGENILKTTDAGGTWFLQKSPTTHTLHSVYFTDVDNGWAVGDSGVILKHQKEANTPLNWAANIKFSTKDYNNREVPYDSLFFGQNTNATNNLDQLLGESELPPIPPNGAFDARFILPDDPTLTSMKDFRRSSETYIIWDIKLQFQDFPLKISWASGDPINLIPGEFNLIDGINGRMLNINMKDTLQIILDSLPQYKSIKIIYQSPESIISEGITVPYSSGWNIISIPLKGLLMTPTEIFSNLLLEHEISNLFGFDGKYFIAENLENGKGYWIKFSDIYDLPLPFSGGKINFPIKVKKGWNLIAPFDKDVPVNQITTQPAGIITSPFYGFDKAYFTSSVLNIGRGYWVKANSDGEIMYNTTAGKAITPIAENKANWGKITVEDNNRAISTLYDVIEKDIDLKQYELPPMPPNGIFDARYSSGLMAEKLNLEGKSILISSASYPISIKAEGIDLRLSYIVNDRQVETIVQSGSRYVIKESSVRSIEVKRAADRTVPKQFALHQNYPNPFNPKTKIRFDLPEKARVNLSIYSILGERIAELVNKEMEAGYHEIDFDARSLASGVYFYKIDTDRNHEVKKMMILK